jgi:hypothetical protein
LAGETICPADIAERAAIISEGSGLSRSDSENLALQPVGLRSFDELVEAHAAKISAILDRFEQPGALAKVTCAFLATDHFREALRLDWTDVQLFGICPHAPTMRVESWGLMIGLVFSPHNWRDKQERYHMTRLVSIDETGATIVTPGGSEFRFDRFHHGLDVAVPWWEVRGLYLPPPF